MLGRQIVRITRRKKQDQLAIPRSQLRTNAWLAERMHTLHQQHFSDVQIRNKLFVRFGRKSKGRFGSIIAQPDPDYILPVTYITINGLFRDPGVPEYVIDATLLHEFAHYTHGFHSPLPRLYEHPHRGNIVNKEIQARNGGHYLKQQSAWIKGEYKQYLIFRGML